MACATCMQGWLAKVGDVDDVLACVACQRELQCWRAGVAEVLALVIWVVRQRE